MKLISTTSLLVGTVVLLSLTVAAMSVRADVDDGADENAPSRMAAENIKRTIAGNNVGSGGIASLRIDPIPANTALAVRVNAGKDECFYEDVRVPGTRVFFHFEVTSGGQLDIDAMVHGPDGSVVWATEKAHEERILFKAAMGGAYRFCLSNKMSSVTAKTVAFSIQSGDAGQGAGPRAGGGSARSGAGTLAADPIERMSLQIAEGLTELRNEQQYLRTRERVHRDTVESTCTRITVYSVAEVLLIVAVGMAQLWYLKSSFDKRRSV